MEQHLENEDPEAANRKNAYNTKQLKKADATFELDTPRDRNADFSPEIVEKRKTILQKTWSQGLLVCMVWE